MTKSENALFHTDQIKACEQQVYQTYHVDETELMHQAGTEAYFFIKRAFSKVKHIAVYCGSGNNAGDGYVLAQLAHEEGYSVIVYQCKAIEELPFAAQHSALLAIAAGVECQSADEPLDSDIELIVDALLGIGLKGPVQGSIASAINQINSSGLPIVSLDVPSGLNANTGQVENYCVKATATITFIAKKLGMYTADGSDYCGEIHCRHLQLQSSIAKYTPRAILLEPEVLTLPLPARRKNSHKGHYGHVLVIGGGSGMPGAVTLAAKAALRSGAGSVTVATSPEHVSAILPLIPEAMVWGVSTAKELELLIAHATVCVVGPGLGDSEWARSLFLAAMTSQLPMVIDASALRLLAENPQVDDNWILTPHPGEAASLLSCSTSEIQNDRYQAAQAIQHQYGGVVVLKGNGTILQTVERNTFVCTKGNPGMASAGMGDILSGIIAGQCAQGVSLSDAAKLGIWIHAMAGDHAAKSIGKIGILASDLLPIIPSILCDLL